MRSAAVAGLLALVLTAAAGGAPPRGDALGLALLARVHRAYVRVPAVSASGRSGSLDFRFSIVLGSGRGVAEQFVGTTPSGTTALVARRGSPTFARDPGTSCWRRVAASDPQALENIGLPFPDEARMQVKAPRRASGIWLLPVVVDGDPATFAIDRRSLLIQSITVRAQGVRIVEHVRTLRAAPKLLAPRPRC